MKPLGILGAHGKMGMMICDVFRKDIRFSREFTLQSIPKRGDSFNGLFSCDVVIDFSLPEATRHYLLQASQQGRLPRLVCGTTGLDSETKGLLEDYSKRAAVVVASNFSVGMTWMTSLLSNIPQTVQDLHPRAAVWERHHKHKKDSPSGTAKSLVEALAVSQIPLDSPVKSLREGDDVGTHEISLQFPFEKIVIRHEALDRHCFAEGALNAALWIARLPNNKGMYSAQDMMETDFNETHSV